jgi:hypothetical protein
MRTWYANQILRGIITGLATFRTNDDSGLWSKRASGEFKHVTNCYTLTQTRALATKTSLKGRTVTASIRIRVEGRQAMRRNAPGTLLNQCRLHKTKRHTQS